jgi:hypothetical protein
MIRIRNIGRGEPPSGIVTVDLGGKRKGWNAVVESKESKARWANFWGGDAMDGRVARGGGVH